MSADNILSDVATGILKRAVELDNSKRYTEAVICYGEGIQVLINLAKGISDAASKSRLHEKIESYISRAEKLKEYVETEKETGSYHEKILIENNSTGNSYKSVFGRFLDNKVNWVVIEDPYIKTYYQCQNFLRFCELIVKSCKCLKNISLKTGVHTTNDHHDWFKMIKQDLDDNYNVEFEVEFSPTLHDREIRLSNGWIIKIGRGLDYFKAPSNKFSLGNFDTDLRLCNETTVDIYHKKDVQVRN